MTPDEKAEWARYAGEVYLDLSYHGLTEVPVGVRCCLKLEYLALKGNPLVEVPDWLAELPRLQYLNLAGVECVIPESVWLARLIQLCVGSEIYDF